MTESQAQRIEQAVLSLLEEAVRCDFRARGLLDRFGRSALSRRKKKTFRRVRRRARHCRGVASAHAATLANATTPRR